MVAPQALVEKPHDCFSNSWPLERSESTGGARCHTSLRRSAVRRLNRSSKSNASSPPASSRRLLP